MTLNVKDSENAAAPASPGAPSTKSPAEAPARPQPVALEVPVTVNGARTVEGSDKREPFSEKSATVLVFGHGAVIRISAVLAPGQLIFLTNEETRKEVVCQVVKSKTDGNAVGYVELRFTEPAPGFWGMRFPSDTVLPQAASRPVAPAPVPAAPKPVPPAAPLAAHPVVSAPQGVEKPVIPAPPAHVTPVSSVASSPEVSSIPSPVVLISPPVSEPKISFPSPVPPPPIVPPAIAQAPPAPVASAPAPPVVDSKPVAAVTSAPLSSSAGSSTEELKQQAARLQEQLSSLLFTEAPKSAAPVSAPPAPTNENVAPPEVANKVLEIANLAPDAAPEKLVKLAPPSALKPAASSLEVEEIKIPSWLAPLARETETSPTPASSFHTEGTNSDVESIIPPVPADEVLSEVQESSRRPETAVFGGQLLGESSQPSDASGSKSKTGLFIGIAASLLLVAGGVWYSRQPGNALSVLLSGSSSNSQHAASAPVSTNTSADPVGSPVASASTPAPAPAHANSPVESTPTPNAPVERATRNTNPVAAPVQRTAQPVVEEPKKPSLGDVHLATPVISRDATSSSSAFAPALDINAASNTAAPDSALGASHRAEPVAPAPIGGDVTPAKLLKSVPPEYPQLARNQRISGNVQIDALIDAEGNVSSMKVLSGPPLLHQAALNALKQWKYQPAQLDGKPTSMHLTVTLQFRTQ